MNSILGSFAAHPYWGVVCFAGFVLWVLLTELVPSWLGGPDSALLYVTLHFIINPVIAVGVACAIMLHGAVQQRLLRKVVGLVIGLLPLWVTYIGITGSTWLTEALGVQFDR